MGPLTIGGRCVTSKKVHLTKRVVDALEPGDEHFIVWDDEVSGLGLRVTKTGVKAFVVDYTTRVGRRRRLTIGRYGVLTVDQARAEAKRVLGSVIGGADPLEEKRLSRSEDTVKEFIKEYLAYVKGYKKPASLRADTYALDKMVEPKLGSHKLSAVTREDVARLHREYQVSPAMSN